MAEPELKKVFEVKLHNPSVTDSRFHVAKVNVDGSSDIKIPIPNIEIENFDEVCESHEKSSTPSPKLGHSPQYNTYVYDPKVAKNLTQITREALPRLEHYKDLSSVHHAQRPTLDALHNDQVDEKFFSWVYTTCEMKDACETFLWLYH